MKKYSLFLLVFLFACASMVKVNMMNKAYPPKPKDADIEIFKTSKPEKPYIEIAELSFGGDWKPIEVIKKRARELGADAIIVTGSAGTRTEAPTYKNNVIEVGGSTTEYGIKAVAIKYK